MEESRLGSSNQIKSSIKVDEIVTSKSKPKNSTTISNIKKILNIFTCFGDLILSLINKINSCLSNCSILLQFSLFLIPISIIMIIIIYFIHVNYYSSLYVFNFSKAFKEEFLDLYITTIDDLKTELTAIVVKETKFDTENQLFFQAYFKELSSVGFIDEDKNFLPNFNEESAALYSKLNDIPNVAVNFNIQADIAKQKIDDRDDDQLGRLAKIYYYMFPHIWYESFLMNSIINQSFFIAYEFERNVSKNEEEEEIEIKILSNDKLFFRFPKNSAGFTINNNFVPNNYLLNPLVEVGDYGRDHMNKENNFFYEENWFKILDYDFRKSINLDEDLLTNISLAHLNLESDGNINKTFITYSQQYIKHANRTYIINIIFFISQNDLKEGDNDYTFFVVKDNFTGLLPSEEITERYSDNVSFVASYSDMTEYSLANMDYRFFHLGLYSINYTFYMNGIFYDSFNLDYFYDYSQFYSSAKDGEYDLKYFASLYLYKSLFQNIKYTKIIKNREEIFLYNFNDREKVQQICEKINFDSYRTYLANSGIDCWDKRNKIYFNEMKFLYVTMDNDSNTIDPIYPYCSCLPLYCLKNYEDLDEDLDNLEFADEINLPNKCQNKFINYESSSTNSEYNGNSKILKLVNSNIEPINYDYIKLIFLELNQLPGHFFFIISQIHTTGEAYIHTYYKLITKIEIKILVLIVLIITSILSIVIINVNMKKYSLIISNFKKKYEFFVFHSDSEESNSNTNSNLSKYLGIKEDKKVEEQVVNNENMQNWETDSLISKDFFNINDNTLLDDLFLIFSETYNITRKDIENFYSKQSHKSKNQMKLDMMKEKNELFELLSTFCLHAPFFQLNLNFDYNMYEYSEIMKKYNHYVGQIENIDKEQTRLTQNILNELISTECIADYGLITNFNFKYVSNIKADLKKNSIKYTMFENIKNRQNKNKENINEEFDNDDIPVKKLVLKRKNVLIEIFKNRFESDDFLNYNKLDSAFNFFLINSYYKYSRQIALENTIS